MVLEVPRQSAAAPSGDVYAIHERAGPASAGLTAQTVVICSVCHTRISAAADQIGQKIPCPDCGAMAVVPPPPPVPVKPAALPTTTEVYPLCEEAPPLPGERRADEEPLIRVVCPRCNTMMYAAEREVGRKLVCQDCGMAMVVPPVPVRRREIDVMAGAGEGYRLAEPYRPRQEETAPPRSSLPSPPQPPPALGEPREAARTESRLDSCGQRPVLPPHPFLNGTFTFPFSRGALLPMVVLTFWPLLAAGLLSGCSLLFSVSISDAWAGPLWFLGIMIGVMTTILMVMWFTYASACCLAVVRDTASGCDAIQNWPDIAFIDWILEPLYVFIALCAGTLPGVVIVRVLMMFDRPTDAVLPLGLFFLFPIVLLSMLENDSPLGIISGPVCRTLWIAWEGWTTFYLTSAVLLAAACGLTIVAFSAGMFLGTVLTAFIEVAAWLIYARLLGRLAWYCAERTRMGDPSDDDADQDVV